MLVVEIPIGNLLLDDGGRLVHKRIVKGKEPPSPLKLSEKP